MESVFQSVLFNRIVINRAVLASVVVFLVMTSPRDAAGQQPPVMTYIYSAPESASDVRAGYNLEVLRTALENTKGKYGEYRMIMSVPMTEKRQIFELRKASGEISVLCLATVPELERNLVGIHIPVDKNLGGYLLFLVRKDQKDEFKHVRSLDDLMKYKFGTGLGWIDVDILKQNGFQVVTGSSYDGLFEMLVNRRFDIFIRTTGEILDEVNIRKATMPELCIEDSICFRILLPSYFWFSKNEEGRRLAGRVKEGMLQMLADGSLDKIFDHYHRQEIEVLNLKGRRIFDIGNHFLGPETPLSDKRLWFDPKTYKPVKQRSYHD